MDYWECKTCGRKVTKKLTECPHCRPVKTAPPEEPAEPKPAPEPEPPKPAPSPPTPKPPKPAVPKPLVKYEFAGAGCVVQGLGLLLLFWFPFGTIIGFVLLIAGSQMAKKWICSECKNPLASNQVTICPACRASYTPQGR